MDTTALTSTPDYRQYPWSVTKDKKDLFWKTEFQQSIDYISYKCNQGDGYIPLAGDSSAPVQCTFSPIFVFKTDKLHCVDCKENLKKHLLKRKGIAEVDGDLEKERLIIKGNVDIVNLIKRIQKIKIDAELIYYKEGRWEDHDQRTETYDKKENDRFCSGVKYSEKRDMFKDQDQGKESRGKKENYGFCCSDQDEVKKNGAKYHEKHNIDEVEKDGAKYHEKRNMFKDQDQKKESRGKKEKERSCDDHEAEDIGEDHYKIHNMFKDHKPEAYVMPKQEYFWGDIQSGMHKKFPSIPGAGSRFTAGFSNYHHFYYPAPWPQQDYM
ncbi:hypothetical protein AgCh_038828 [Apium graveolens]